MRKLVSLGVFALFLSVLASPLSADVSDCDELTADADAPKGLYGLCIAYYNSVNGKGRDRIAELFEKKAEAAGYDPVIPGTGVVDTVLLDCPCWTAQELIDAVTDDSGIEKNCTTYSDDVGWWDYFELGLYPPEISFQAGVDYGDTFCSYATSAGEWRLEFVGSNGVTEADIAACHTQLNEIPAAAGVDCTFSE